MTRGAAITGWGHALPDQVITNQDMTTWLDTSDEWIVERTGIRERRIGGTTADLAVSAGHQAISRAGLLASDIDLLVLTTSTPDKAVPATSTAVHRELGISGGGFDLNAACAGFVYGLVTANAMVAGGVDRVLLVGSDTVSRLTDPSDRSTAILFADGAGAVVIEATGDDETLLGWDLGADGSALHLLYCEHGGHLYMEGQEVFRRAVRVMVASARNALEQAKMSPSDIALCVPHQANLRIIEAANQRLGIVMERTAISLTDTGNTSSASIPIALARAADEGRVLSGENVLLCGFGAGMTWASAVIRWSR